MATTENLLDLARRLQGIIDTAIDGIITINDKGIIESMNRAALVQFGYAIDELKGKNIHVLMPEPYHSEHDTYINNYIKTRVPRIIGIGREVIGKRKNGQTFPFRLAVSEVVLNDRLIFNGIIHDLTDVKKAENDLMALNEALESKVEQRTLEIEHTVNQLLQTNKILEKREEELELALVKEKELNDLKSRFVSMASHEFRTPLSTILSSVNLISRYTDDHQQDKRAKHVDRIKSAVNNLTGILNDFLSLSKIEEGKIQVQSNSFDMSHLCDEVITEVSGMLKDGHSIIKDYESPLLIHSDQRILKNVLFNLISNAIKYSKSNGVVRCVVKKNQSRLLIRIIDNGIGIPKDDQKHLFARFFRASNVINIQGTGLGLSIVKRYVEMLDGTISFESTESDGTTFMVSIPT